MKKLNIIKKLSIILMATFIVLFSLSNIYAQDEASSKSIEIGLRGTVEFSLLTYLSSPAGDVSANCGTKGDLGLTAYFGLTNDIMIGFDFNYMAGGLFNFHFGYKQDFMPGPIVLAMNLTGGYDLYVDGDGDTGHGFGVQATFYGGYEILEWLEVGADIGLNFALIFSDVSGEPATLTFLTLPLRLFVGFKF